MPGCHVHVVQHEAFFQTMSLLWGNYGGGQLDAGSNALDSKCNVTSDVSLHVRVLGTTVFVLAWPFIVFDIPRIPIGRPTAALAGGMFMVISRVLTQDQVYKILGEHDNLQTLYLLIGMMILSYFFEREGIIQALLIKSFKADQPFSRILWKTCVMSGALAAFVTNDAACVMLTPLLLKEHKKQGRSRNELLPTCLAIATSANIGSAATVFGNPQNAYIASQADVSLSTFFRAILPAAVVGIAVNTGLLYFMSWKRGLFGRASRYDPIEDAGANGDLLQASSFEEPQPTPTDNVVHDVLQQSTRDTAVQASGRTSTDLTTKKKIFAGWLIFVSIAVVSLLAVPSNVAYFSLGLVPLGAAIGCMIFDAVLNKTNPYVAITHAVDWTVIVMFMGLFVWDEGFQVTGYPTKAFNAVRRLLNVHTVSGIALFSLFITVGSNVLSNVPLVILFIKELPCLQGTHALKGCLLAWVSTVAGNLTLIGSVANLIVAEKAKNEAGYTLGFWDYLKFGFPSTILIITIGLPIVAALA